MRRRTVLAAESYRTFLPIVTRPVTLTASDGLEQDMAQRINAERAARGLPALNLVPEVFAAARGHSIDMAAMGSCQHAGSDGSNCGDRLREAGYIDVGWGESVGAASISDPAYMLSAWMGSAGHRGILLTTTLDDLGVGYAVSQDGSMHYWTAVVAKRAP